jgi:hypothetical protein
MSVTNAKGNPGFPSHNYIINGAFDIWQRGTSLTVATGNYGADRWRAVQTADMAIDTEVPSEDFKQSAKITGGATLTFRGFAQRIEASNAVFLAGKTATFSAWVKVNAASLANGGYIVLSRATGATDNDWATSSDIGSSRTFASLGVVADTWTRVTFSEAVPTTATKGIQAVIFANGPTNGGSAGIVYITGVQLEAGSVATPFKIGRAHV